MSLADRDSAFPAWHPAWQPARFARRTACAQPAARGPDAQGSAELVMQLCALISGDVTGRESGGAGFRSGGAGDAGDDLVAGR